MSIVSFSPMPRQVRDILRKARRRYRELPVTHRPALDNPICRDNQITIDRDNCFINLRCEVGWVFGANGEQTLYCHDWADAADRVSYGMPHLERDWDLSAWPDRATDPVTAGIVADYLEERDADPNLVEQYREVAYEGEL